MTVCCESPTVALFHVSLTLRKILKRACSRVANELVRVCLLVSRTVRFSHTSINSLCGLTEAMPESLILGF